MDISDFTHIHSEASGSTVSLSDCCDPSLSRTNLWRSILLPKNGSDTDSSQIELDIARSFIGFPLISNPDTALLTHYREHLRKVLLRFFVEHPECHYYQGLHDVASIIIYALRPPADSTDACSDEDLYVAFKNLALRNLRDALSNTMQPVVSHLHIVHRIIQSENPDVAALLPPGLLPALPWVITLFSHSVSVQSSLEILDFLLQRHPSAVLYLSAAVILRTAPKLAQLSESPEDEEDLHALVHRVLTDLHDFSSETDLDWQANLRKVFESADRLAKRIPLSSPNIQIHKLLGAGSVMNCPSTHEVPAENTTVLPIGGPDYTSHPYPASELDDEVQRQVNSSLSIPQRQPRRSIVAHASMKALDRGLKLIVMGVRLGIGLGLGGALITAVAMSWAVED